MFKNGSVSLQVLSIHPVWTWLTAKYFQYTLAVIDLTIHKKRNVAGFSIPYTRTSRYFQAILGALKAQTDTTKVVKPFS